MSNEKWKRAVITKRSLAYDDRYNHGDRSAHVTAGQVGTSIIVRRLGDDGMCIEIGAIEGRTGFVPFDASVILAPLESVLVPAYVFDHRVAGDAPGIRAATAVAALARIRCLFDGQEVDSDTLGEVAAVLRDAGLLVDDI